MELQPHKHEVKDEVKAGTRATGDEVKPEHASKKSELSENDQVYPGPKIVLPTLLAVCLTAFLVALDRTIIGVAIPAISNEFMSFGQISWYESAYLLTSAAFQLPMGKIYTFFPAKWTFIASTAIFLIGSIICTAAPISNVFIVGRAISGIGSAGITTGSNIVFVDLLPLERRAKYFGAIGAVFGLASIAGPLLGGVFTTKVTWRWIFWLNHPIGGASMLALLLILPTKPPARKHVGNTWQQRIRQFDPLGTALLLPGLVLLLLALQWGGTQYPWSSARVIVLLVLGLLLLTVFCISQRFTGENATVPPRIFSQRTVAGATAVSFTFGSVLLGLTFYLPIWFQAIKGKSAVGAGERMLPYFLVTVFFVIGGGFLVNKIGYYTPVLIVGSAILIIGVGLLTTFKIDTTNATWIGYEILIGVGMGLTLTQPNNAVQTVLVREDIPIGITIISFAQLLGGSVFIPICQAVLFSTLSSQLNNRIPGLDVAKLSSTGATDISQSVSMAELPVLLTAYNNAVVNIFYCALGMACAAFIASFIFEWKSMKKQQPGDAEVASATL